MNRQKLIKLYKKYNLTPEDVFKHQHYLIITRTGIEKIQAVEKIVIKYYVVNCEKDFCVVKAVAEKNSVTIETFGSALKGATHKEGNCNSWYVMEFAEKRAMSRAILKIIGAYSLGVFGEDESESFRNET